MEPWFYERRFLRPRFARQPILEVLRRLSAAHELGDRTTWDTTEPRSLETDVLVVGGGPTGLSAAAAVSSNGTRTLVLTQGPAGGRQPRSTTARVRVEADLAALRTAGADVLQRSLCVGYYGGEDVFAAISDRGPVMIRAARVVVATGAYDRTLIVPGIDLPGVLGARAFERLAGQGAFGERHRIGVFAAPGEAERVVASAQAAGLSLTWIAGPGELPVGAVWAHPGTRLRRIEGRRRVRRVTLDDDHELQADIVVVGFTQPTYELQVQLGQRASIGGEPPVVQTSGTTVMPMIVIGEAAGDLDPDGAAERAAASTTAWLSGPSDTPVLPTTNICTAIDLDPDATVCICEDVTVAAIDRAIADGFGDIELLKRRSGACTGACQGKLCLGPVGEVLQARGLATGLPTIRPPIRPVSVASLGGETA